VLPVRYELNLCMLCRKVDRLYGLAVKSSYYRTEIYCVPCDVRTEFIYVM
jgi:hypothetical protein